MSNCQRNTAFIKGNDKVKADYDGSKGIRCRVAIIVTAVKTICHPS